MDGIIAVPGGTEQVRHANRVLILRPFLEGGPRSAGEVSALVGLSRQTVMKAIQFFLRTGLLVPAGKGSSTELGGKRPELFELNRDRYFLCITMWPEYLRIRLVTIGGGAAGDLIREDVLPGDPREALKRVCRLAAELVRDTGLRMEQVAAVSISTAGIMDYGSGSLRYSSQSPDWGSDVPLKRLLGQWFGADKLIIPENTGKMAARPFLLDPDLADKRVMVIFACWGLSACLMDRGEILSGRNSLIGEIGHMTIDAEDREICGCGGRGCLERLVSAERLRSLAKEWRPAHPESVLDPAALTVPGLFRASEAGDPLAVRLAEYLAGQFAIALRNVSLVFDPDVVIFQGDFAHADDHFRRKLTEQLGEFRYFPAGGPFELRFDRRDLAEMDAAGSVIALMRSYFSRPELYMD